MENKLLIPATVVGSHPKPSWWHNCKDLHAEGKWGETDLSELLTDAVDVAILDQTRAGLDIITDGENGCLFNPDGKNDGSESLIKATQRLLKNDLEHQTMRKAAREEAERWGWASATEQLRRYYRDVLEQKSIKLVA